MEAPAMRKLLFFLILGLLAALAVGCSSDEEIVDTTAPASGSPAATASRTPTGTATAPPSGTSTPTVTGWQEHSDTATGLLFEFPAGLNVSESSVDVTGKDGVVRVHRIITIETPSGLPGAALAIAPNPDGLPLQEWIEMNPGWTSEPTATSVASQPALRFPLNASGEAKPVIYFAYGGFVISIKRVPSNTQNDGLKPVISETEFERLLASLRAAS
jgi:hypothetical protein